jgi:hypothetical protein
MVNNAGLARVIVRNIKQASIKANDNRISAKNLLAYQQQTNNNLLAVIEDIRQTLNKQQTSPNDMVFNLIRDLMGINVTLTGYFDIMFDVFMKWELGIDAKKLLEAPIIDYDNAEIKRLNGIIDELKDMLEGKEQELSVYGGNADIQTIVSDAKEKDKENKALKDRVHELEELLKSGPHNTEKELKPDYDKDDTIDVPDSTLVQMYRGGRSTSYMAGLFHTTQRTIINKLGDAYLQQKTLIDYMKVGMTAAQISDKTGIDIKAIEKRINKIIKTEENSAQGG